MSLSTGSHDLDWIEAGRTSQRSEVSGTVDPYAQAQIGVTAEGAGIRVVRVTGDLGSGSVASLDEILVSQISARLAGLVVDLSTASFVGVRGVAAVVYAAERARQRGLALSVVIGEHAEITRVLSRVCRGGGGGGEGRGGGGGREGGGGGRGGGGKGGGRGGGGGEGGGGGRGGGEDALLVHTSLNSSLHACRGLLAGCDAAATCVTESSRSGGDVSAGKTLMIALHRQPDHATVTSAVSWTGPESAQSARRWRSCSSMSNGSPSTSRSFRSAGFRHCRCSRRLLPRPEAGHSPTDPLRGLAGGHRIASCTRRTGHGAAGSRPRGRASPAGNEARHNLAIPPFLDPHLASPRRARALFRRACMDWALGNAYDHAALVVNELVTNAVRHARTSCRLDIRLDARGLRVAVRDHGPVHPALIDDTGHLPRCGTGLHLVATLSHRWGVEQHADGKTVWVDLAPRPA